VARLERQNCRLKLGGLGVLPAIGGLVFVGMAMAQIEWKV